MPCSCKTQIGAHWHVTTKLRDAGAASIRQQQQLAPELKALLQLSKDRHSGWIARFDEALKPQNTPAGALSQSLLSGNHQPGPLESHDVVRAPARPYSCSCLHCRTPYTILWAVAFEMAALTSTMLCSYRRGEAMLVTA